MTSEPDHGACRASSAQRLSEIEAKFPFARSVLLDLCPRDARESVELEGRDSLDAVARKCGQPLERVLDVLDDGLARVRAAGLDVHAFQRLLTSGEPLLLVDVREPWEFAVARLEGSVLLADVEVDAILKQAAATPHVVLICHHGIRALSATLAFQEHGVPQALCLTGGLDAYSRQIDPTLPRY